MWGLVVGVVSYFPAAWYGHRFLEDQGMEAGFTRKLSVFLFASVVSTALGYGVSLITTSPAHRREEAGLQHQALQILGSAARCAQDPTLPQCAQNRAEAQELLGKILGGDSTKSR
ncbi:MAG: hypothetical protein ACP5D5_02405 [Acidithiobacillus sp.]|uniref:hypothetical protein n=1 Tax=Acidithiobacillus sp. TaxID=1872118 RepID=UPI0025C27A41|nr:hypothetical protein [Acidithiobacillus sp.]